MSTAANEAAIPAAPAEAADTATNDAPEAAATSDAADVVDAAKSEDEDCGFCTYMHAGPCGEVFTAWEACVEDHRTRDADFTKGCVPATRELTKCMSEHKDYYELPDQEAPVDASADADAPETAPVAAATAADAPAAAASVEPTAADEQATESRAAA